MTRQLDNRIWANHSQQTTNNVTISFLEHHNRQMKPMTRVIPISVHRVNGNHNKTIHKYYDEYAIEDKEKDAATGRWVLNVIEAHEAYKKAMKMKKTPTQSTIIHAPIAKKHSFQSRKSSRVEPIENPTTQLMNNPFYQSQIEHEASIRYPQQRIISPTTIDDVQSETLSDFSSAASVDHVRTPKRPTKVSQERPQIHSDDYSTDKFEDSNNVRCFSKRTIIIATIISVLLIIGIVIAVFVTIFVGRNESTTNTSGAKMFDMKFLPIRDDKILCPTDLFNLTDPLCQGQNPYKYYSCYQLAKSTSMTIRFAFQHDTPFGHWYFDDISIQQNQNIQLITNGDFESNLTGWNVNTSEIYVDTNSNLAHTGSGYLYGKSKNHLNFIEQTFNVVMNEYVHVSFWWRYDAGFNLGNTCRVIGQLICI